MAAHFFLDLQNMFGLALLQPFLWKTFTPYGSGGTVDHSIFALSHKGGQMFKLASQHNHVHCHRDQL